MVAVYFTVFETDLFPAGLAPFVCFLNLILETRLFPLKDPTSGTQTNPGFSMRWPASQPGASESQAGVLHEKLVKHFSQCFSNSSGLHTDFSWSITVPSHRTFCRTLEMLYLYFV